MLTLFQHRGGKCTLWIRCLQDDATQRQSASFIYSLTASWGSPASAIYRQTQPASESRLARTRMMVRWGWLSRCHVRAQDKDSLQTVDGGDLINPTSIGSSCIDARVPSVSDIGAWWTRTHHNMSEAVQEVAVQCAGDCCFFFLLWFICAQFFLDLCLLVNMKNNSAFYDINSLHTADICNRVKTLWFDLFVSSSLFLWSLQSGRTTRLRAPVFNVYIYVHQ